MRADMRLRLAGIAAVLLVVAPRVVEAQAVNSSNYDEVYARYLAAARRSPDSTRSLWMTDLLSDVNAHHLNDLVTIRVIESPTRSGSRSPGW